MAKRKRSAPRPSGASDDQIDLPPVASGAVGFITAEELLRVMNRVKVLDCRSGPERKLGLIPGSIPYNPNRFEAENAPAVPVVCLSWTNKRSLVAAYRLVKQGYIVYQLKGGMWNWQRQGYPKI
ncbi:MAG: rhodanese-like domain-containing protein [Gemmatimonadaceae bacterium]|nr:rhodanese-like domain-containing protein [Gloeobacterales cyanobacterium ES-bin-141]